MRWRIVLVAIPALLLALASIALSMVGRTSIVGFTVTAVFLMAIGAFLVVKVPTNRVGMVLAAGGAGGLIYTAAGEYARLSLATGPFPGEYLAAWLGSWVGALLPASLSLLLLLFPDGRVQRGWRWLVGILGLVVASALFGATRLWGLPAGLLTDFDALDLHGAYVWVDQAFGAGFVSAVPAAASLIFRYRNGTSVERQQIKWLAAAAGVFAMVVAAGILADQSGIWEWILSASMALVPVAVAFAVLRYRLYDIDTIISRTVTYGLVVGLLGIVVLGLVAALAIVLPSDDPLLVAVATLVAFILFNPLRRRVHSFVDRYFNRARYDAQRVMVDFTGKLQEQVDANRMLEGWVGVVSDTMQPTTVGVWVRE